MKAPRLLSLALTVVLLCSNAVLAEPPAAAASSSFTFGAAGDFGFNADANATFTAAGAAGLDLFLVLGDTTYAQTTETTWCNALRAQVPHALVQAGNHDIGEDVGANLGALLAACPYTLAELPGGDYGREWFFDYPGAAPLARFVLTGCGNVFDTGNGSTWACAAGDAHYRFVSGAIDGARTAGIPWVIVGMHKNCLSTATKSCEIGADFFNLLLDKRVDLILQGHDHVYQRSKQLVCATPNLYRPACVIDDGADGRYAKGNGSVVVIQGTGGRSHYADNASDTEAPYFADAFDDTYGFAKYTVNATAIQVDFVRSAGGGNTDSFVIDATGPPPPPPDLTPPSIALTGPMDGALTNLSSVWVGGATEPGARVSVDGLEATVGVDGTFGLLLGLRPGPNLVVVTAWDAAGNPANATLNVTFVDPIPTLEAELASARSELATLQAQTAAFEAEANATQAQLALANANLSAASARVAALEADANTTQAELAAAQANVTLAQADLAALQDAENSTRVELAAARVNLTTAQGRLSTVEANLSVAQAQQNATRTELDEARAQADSAGRQAVLATGVGLAGLALGAVGLVLALRSRKRKSA